MAEVEKYIPKRIVSDVHPESIQRDGTRKFLPGDSLDAENCRYYGYEDHGILRSVKGNVLKDYSLPSGLNVVIGSIFYKTEGTILFFLWNEGNDHRIIEYDHQTGTFTTLVSASWLNFSKDHYLTGGGVIDNLVPFSTDNAPLRFINVTRARTGYYQSFGNEIAIQLMSMPPSKSPTAALVTDSSVSFNYVSGVNLQFSYRFIYLDNQVSVFSNRSKLIPAALSPNPTVNTNNAVDVTVYTPSEILKWVKTIEVGYQLGNAGDIFIFETITPTSSVHTVRFKNNGRSIATSKQEQITLSHLLPPISPSVAIVENRVFTLLESVGFDVVNSFTFNAVAVAETATTPTPDPIAIDPYEKRYFKDGCTYGVALVYEDEMGRSSFARQSKYISFPFQDAVIEAETKYGVSTNRKKISWSLTGTPPPGMKRYKIVLSKNNNAVYGQCLANPLKYVREIKAGEDDNTMGPSAGAFVTFNWRGKNYDHPFFFNDTITNWASIYLQIPTNFPFVVEPGMIVRVMNPGFTGDRNLVVKQVIGDLIDVGKISMGNSDHAGFPSTIPWFIEIVKQKTTQDDLFYEIGEEFEIVNGNFTVTSGSLYGDTYLIELSAPDKSTERFYNYEKMLLAEFGNPAFTRELMVLFNRVHSKIQRIESPANIFQSSLISRSSGSSISDQEFTVVTAKTLNYNFIDSDYGRPHIINRNEKKSNFNSTLGFSNPYIQDSNINGLNVFLAENQYSLAAERTKIKALVRASGVLLAIHERNCSSMYIGEGILRQGADFLLAKTASVIGDDRQLKGEYGTANPESIKEVDGDVYWWDGHRGRVLRYTLAGVDAISKNGMTSYFRNKAKQYAPYRTTAKIISGFDYDNGEFLITFPTVIVNSVVIIQGVTWAFDVKEEVWTTRYSFIPECYADNTLNLFSFKNGGLWAHEENLLYNNFYGVQYLRKWKFAPNPKIADNKKYLNIHIEGDISTDMTNEDVVVRCYTKQGQESYIPAHEFELDEGKWCAPFLKDINSPVSEGIALQSGDDLVSRYMEVELICNRTDKAPVSEVNIIYKTENFSI